MLMVHQNKIAFRYDHVPQNACKVSKCDFELQAKMCVEVGLKMLKIQQAVNPHGYKQYTILKLKIVNCLNM